MKEATGKTEPWERVEELFHAALDRPEEGRTAFLTEACAGNPALLARVEALLAADGGADALVGRAVSHAFALATDASDAAEGEGPVLERVGAYRILREIGRGGLSTVYLAERDDEHFHKRVAIKVVRKGLDTEDVLERFRHERQILARFEHPNMARLLDGGTTADGRPFFVMEHVDGEPIDRYCESRALDLRRRIELFQTVCEAVSYAHQSLVVHRDLKPSNILVTTDGQPKLLDFGIAKLLDPDELALPQFRTRTGLLVLTPAYASPEQLRGEVLTTQTDVYSLGLVLYQLLTGKLPHPTDGRRLQDLQRTDTQLEPAKPSAGLDAETFAKTRLPQSRRSLERSLRGDLDTIVLKALREDPRRRYTSVGFLSEDLRRFLSGERVLARPEGLGYRLAKWIRRHRPVVASLAAAAVLLIAVVAFYTLRLRDERDSARFEAERAERVSSLLVGMLEVSDPSQARGETITVRELLAPAVVRIESELANQPAMRASLKELIGSIYGKLGLHREAQPLLDEALLLRRRLHPAPHPKIADSLDRLGELSYQKGDFDAAESAIREALEQRMTTLGADHPAVGKSLNDLAAVLQARGRLDSAEALYRRAVATQLAGGGEGRETLVTQANLASLLYRSGRLDEAEALCRSTLSAQKAALGADHPDVAFSENTLAAILIEAGQSEEAEILLRRGVERQRKLYGPEHPNVAVSLTNLGAFLYRQERFDEAEENYLEALALQEQVLDGENLQVLATVINLANLESFGKRDRGAAAAWLRRGAQLQNQLLGPRHPELAATLLRLAAMELKEGRPEGARRLLGEVLNIHREATPDTVPGWQQERAMALEAKLKASR